MFTRTLFAAAVFAASFAGVASARDASVTAQLQAAPAHARVISNTAIWNCADASCQATIQDVSVRACHEFARKSHAVVTAFGSADRQLTADEIAQCNGDAASNTLQANAAGH